jgi:hypothetical protein
MVGGVGWRAKEHRREAKRGEVALGIVWHLLRRWWAEGGNAWEDGFRMRGGGGSVGLEWKTSLPHKGDLTANSTAAIAGIPPGEAPPGRSAVRTRQRFARGARTFM